MIASLIIRSNRLITNCDLDLGQCQDQGQGHIRITICSQILLLRFWHLEHILSAKKCKNCLFVTLWHWPFSSRSSVLALKKTSIRHIYSSSVCLTCLMFNFHRYLMWALFLKIWPWARPRSLHNTLLITFRYKMIEIPDHLPSFNFLQNKFSFCSIVAFGILHFTRPGPWRSGHFGLKSKISTKRE